MNGRGVVISVHLNGATVRLDDGSLASVPSQELAANRPAFVASLQKRAVIDLALERTGRHCAAFLARGGASRIAPISAQTPAPAATSYAPVVEDDAGDELELDEVDGHELEDDLEDGEIVRTLRLVDGASSPNDALFEHRINAYLKSTEEWAPADRPPPDERHQSRKKKRAAFFESRAAKQPE